MSDIITMEIQQVTSENPVITMTKDRYNLLIEQANRRDRCWHCGGGLIWREDTQTTDGALNTSLVCEQCGAEVEYFIGGGSE